MNAWGPEPIRDNKGNTLMDKQAIAAQILNDSAHFLRGNARVLSAQDSDEYEGTNGPSDGENDGSDIGINVAPIERSSATALKYLNLFESSRLGNKLTAEDQLFSRVIE